jgi:toxin ParE1/3/4
MRVVWRARARADIDSMLAHVSPESPAGAARMHAQVLSMIDLLMAWPDLGKPSRKAGVRELVVPHTPYVLLYRHRGRKVFILRVLHGSRRR